MAHTTVEVCLPLVAARANGTLKVKGHCGNAGAIEYILKLKARPEAIYGLCVINVVVSHTNIFMYGSRLGGREDFQTLTSSDNIGIFHFM